MTKRDIVYVLGYTVLEHYNVQFANIVNIVGDRLQDITLVSV